MFTTYGEILKNGLVSIYKKSKYFKYDFKSFDKNSVLTYIPSVLKLDELNDESDYIEEAEYINKKNKVKLNKKCEAYLEMRKGLEVMDIDQIRNLKKKMESILIRKNILSKKQKMKQIEQQIKVR